MSGAFRAGSVAVIGRPNVGKSTLVNALVGAKISIVSPKAQTTRHRLLGIATFPEGQLLLVDTPGIHGKQKKAMNRYMNRAARGAVVDVQAAVLMVEAGRWVEDDALAYEALKESGVPVVLVVNKVDKFADKTALLPFIAEVTRERQFVAVHPVSALKRKGHEALVKTLIGLMPESEPLYGEDEITDRSERFLAGELVREQLMLRLGEPEAHRHRQGRRTPQGHFHQCPCRHGKTVRPEGVPGNLVPRARGLVRRRIGAAPVRVFGLKTWE
jgi:GTP-binding protein Era